MNIYEGAYHSIFRSSMVLGGIERVLWSDHRCNLFDLGIKEYAGRCRSNSGGHSPAHQRTVHTEGYRPPAMYYLGGIIALAGLAGIYLCL